MDRLITELKLPPNDAYHKLRHTIEEVNALLIKYGGEDVEQVGAHLTLQLSRLLLPAGGRFCYASAIPRRHMHAWIGSSLFWLAEGEEFCYSNACSPAGHQHFRWTR